MKSHIPSVYLITLKRVTQPTKHQHNVILIFEVIYMCWGFLRFMSLCVFKRLLKIDKSFWYCDRTKLQETLLMIFCIHQAQSMLCGTTKRCCKKKVATQQWDIGIVTNAVCWTGAVKSCYKAELELTSFFFCNSRGPGLRGKKMLMMIAAAPKQATL